MDFNKIVYVIRGWEIKAEVLKDLCEEAAEETTSPRGIEPRIFSEGKSVYTWWPGGEKTVVQKCDTEQDAVNRKLECWKYDLDENRNGEQPVYFETKEEADKFLSEIKEDHDSECRDKPKPTPVPEYSAPKMTGQLWEGCERCGQEPCYMPLHLCKNCWPK